jgi:hypothetical protein
MEKAVRHLYTPTIEVSKVSGFDGNGAEGLM